MKKKNSHFTLMLIPEENGKTLTLRIPKFFVYFLIVFLISFFVGLFFLLFKSGEIAAKLQLLSLIKSENDNLSKENDELRNISEKITEFTKFSEYLNNLAIPNDLKDNYNIKNDTLGNNSNVSVVRIEGIKSDSNFLSNRSNLVSNNIPNILPVNGWITRHFIVDSLNPNQGHMGLDFAAATGTPIKATAPGVVAKIENDKYFGLIITLFHEGGFVTKYGHCSQTLVSLHDRINRGQTIALVGSTGRSSAPHLHYEVLKDGKNIDPSEFILIHKD